MFAYIILMFLCKGGSSTLSCTQVSGQNTRRGHSRHTEQGVAVYFLFCFFNVFCFVFMFVVSFTYDVVFCLLFHFLFFLFFVFV